MQDDIKTPPKEASAGPVPQPAASPTPAANPSASNPTSISHAASNTANNSTKPKQPIDTKTEHHLVPIFIALLILVFLAAVAILGDKNINP